MVRYPHTIKIIVPDVKTTDANGFSTVTTLEDQFIGRIEFENSGVNNNDRGVLFASLKAIDDSIPLSPKATIVFGGKEYRIAHVHKLQTHLEIDIT